MEQFPSGANIEKKISSSPAARRVWKVLKDALIETQTRRAERELIAYFGRHHDLLTDQLNFECPKDSNASARGKTASPKPDDDTTFDHAVAPKLCASKPRLVAR